MNERVAQIISQEHKRLDLIANSWIKGLVSEANNAMYQLFMDYGYTSDCEDTQGLTEYINELISNTMSSEPEIWKQVMSFPEYEITVDGSIRRSKNKHMVKVYPQDRVKLTKDGKVVTAKIWDLVWENWYKNKEDKKEEMEYIDMSSDFDPMDYNDMRFCGTTETQL